jgi:hypothetical protein
VSDSTYPVLGCGICDRRFSYQPDGGLCVQCGRSGVVKGTELCDSLDFVEAADE